MKTGTILLTALAGLASGANAATTWMIDISYSNGLGYLGPGDTATVQIWAAFDDDLYAFAGAALNVVTDEVGGHWSDIGRDLSGPGTVDGVANGGSVEGIIIGQLHYPPEGIFADTSNPVKAWHGTFSADGPWDHNIHLSTATSKFDAFLDIDANGDGFADGTSESVFNDLKEGHALIVVLPSPSAVSVLGLGILATSRRRAVKGVAL